MRLIDADALLESEIERYGCVPAVCTTTINGEYLDDVLDRQPTIDAEPVRHGKWELFDYEYGGEPSVGYICSECGRIEGFPYPYCHCGAKMDLEGDNG